MKVEAHYNEKDRAVQLVVTAVGSEEQALLQALKASGEAPYQVKISPVVDTVKQTIIALTVPFK